MRARSSDLKPEEILISVNIPYSRKVRNFFILPRSLIWTTELPIRPNLEGKDFCIHSERFKSRKFFVISNLHRVQAFQLLYTHATCWLLFITVLLFLLFILPLFSLFKIESYFFNLRLFYTWFHSMLLLFPLNKIWKTYLSLLWGLEESIKNVSIESNVRFNNIRFMTFHFSTEHFHCLPTRLRIPFSLPLGFL